MRENVEILKKKVRLILLSIDVPIKKQRETVQKETSVKIGFQKYVIYRGLKKIICGGFINIQERRTIMKIQSGTERSNKLSWKV